MLCFDLRGSAWWREFDEYDSEDSRGVRAEHSSSNDAENWPCLPAAFRQLHADRQQLDGHRATSLPANTRYQLHILLHLFSYRSKVKAEVEIGFL